MLKQLLRAADALDKRLVPFRARRIVFPLEGIPATITRKWVTGRVTLEARGNVLELQGRLMPPRFNVPMPKQWSMNIGGHDVLVEIVPKMPFPFLRPFLYRIAVDGTLVREARYRF